MSLKQRLGKSTLLKKQLFKTFFSATNKLNTLFLVSLLTMINTEERTLTGSPCTTVLSNSLKPSHIGVVQICAPLSFMSQCLVKNQPITVLDQLLLSQRSLQAKKIIWWNLTVSQYFRPVAKMDSKPSKTLVTVIALCS